MADLPTGTVTFLYTDLEGSTARWERHPAAMRAAVARHDALLRAAIAAHYGHVFRTAGDGLCAAFAVAPDAVAAALAAQLALHAEPWGETGPLRARMALHTGAAEVQGGDYVGACLNRIGRLLAAGHGGQIILSGAVQPLVRDALPAASGLHDLGEHRLRDLTHPERVHQLLHPDLPADFPALRSLDAYPHNLPLQLTSFVGREAEMAAVRGLLGTSRLLTLTGTGGCGKTRLALEVAADLVDAYPDGVWLAELAPVTDPELVAQTVAFAVGIAEQPGQPLITTLVGALRGRRLLLVLDNCEHLLDAGARLAEALLRGCPGVRALATSRELLGAAGETAWRVPSLAAPDPRAPLPAERLLDYPAVRLFVERARQVRPGFAVTEPNAAAVARICARLDGIPLALELAAARATALSVEQIAARLDDRFRLLTGGRRTALRRQQTLAAAIDWSHALLTGPERALLRRLSAFAGGWTLEAAEAVGSGDGIEADEVLDLLTRLVEKSLVAVEERDGAARYRLLETIRQYAGEKLLAAGEAAAARDRHRDWCLALAERAAPALHGPEIAAWLARLEAEHDNLRGALEWCLADERGAEAGLRLAGALGWFWFVRDYLSEGRGWSERALARRDAAPAAARVAALEGAAGLARAMGDSAAAGAWYDEMLTTCRRLDDRAGGARALAAFVHQAGRQGDYAEARTLVDESVTLARAADDAPSLAFALLLGGFVAYWQGEYATARAWLEESLAHCRRLGERVIASFALSYLGQVAAQMGEHRLARAAQEQSLAIKQELGMRRGIAFSIQNLGLVAQLQGDAAEAGARHREAIRVTQDIGAGEYLPRSLDGLAWVAASRGRGERAARLFGAAAALRDATGLVVPQAERAMYAHAVAVARSALSEAAFATAWAEGEALTPEAAVAEALADGPAAG